MKFNNTSESIGLRGNREYFRWRVYVDEPPNILATIKEVEYLLHSTFPEPQQIRTNPTNSFALETSGWGTFTIQVTVRFNDSHEEHLGYELKLGAIA